MKQSGAWLALAALAFAPFAYRHFDVPQQLVLALGVVVLSYVCRSIEVSRAHVLALASVVLAALVTTFSSTAPSISWSAFVTFFVVAALSMFARDVKPVLWVTWPIAAWAFMQVAGLDPFVWSHSATWCGGMRPFSTLGHPTQLGVWMALISVLALDDARTRHSAFSWATAALAAMTCVVTLSRAGWLTLAVGVGAWLLLTKTASRRIVLIGGALFVVAALVAGPSAIAERLTNFFVAPTRLALWKTALAGFQLHPLTGWGFDAFVLVDQQLRQLDAWKYEWGTTATHAHSFLANTLATQGVFGIVAVLVALGVTVRSWRRDGIGNSGAAAATIAWAVASMVCFSEVLVAALGACVFAMSFERKKTFTLPGWLPLVTLVPCAFTLFQFGAAVAAARPTTDSKEAVRMLDIAERLEPTSSLWPVLIGQHHEVRGELELAKDAYVEAARVTPGSSIFEANIARVASKRGERAALEGFERARRLAPLDAHIAVDAAEASMRLGEWDLAAATLANTLGHYPQNGVAWWALARTRYAQNRTLEARAALEASVQADWRDWPEGLGLARNALVELALSAGDVERAEKYASRPAQFAAPADICGAPARLK